jgi:hypothetical protein
MVSLRTFDVRPPARLKEERNEIEMLVAGWCVMTCSLSSVSVCGSTVGYFTNYRYRPEDNEWHWGKAYDDIWPRPRLRDILAIDAPEHRPNNHRVEGNSNER